MADARAYLRALALSGLGFEDILAQSRHLLIEDLGDERFITLLFAELDPATGVWRYVNAGHPPGYVLGRTAMSGTSWRRMPRRSASTAPKSAWCRGGSCWRRANGSCC